LIIRYALEIFQTGGKHPQNACAAFIDPKRAILTTDHKNISLMAHQNQINCSKTKFFSVI
jgi:hypothetical protein